MPTDADFLAAVIADPASDGPRLIYADWLEDNGNDARAEFIRVQCALAQMSRSEKAHHPLAVRETELLRDHRAAWRAPLDRAMFPNGEAESFAPIRAIAEIAGAVLSFGRFNFAAEFVRRLLSERWEFRRGFAEKLYAVAAAYLPAAEAIRSVTPLRSLDLNLDGNMAPLANCERLADLESLRLFGRGETATGFPELLASPHLAGLKRCGLGDLSLAGFEIIELSQSRLLSQLEELYLGGIACGNPGLRSLLAATSFPTLIKLTLRGCGQDVDWPAIFAEWPDCPHLTELDLSSNALGDSDLGALFERLPAIEDLGLRETGMTEYGLRSLLRSPRLRQLRRLDLASNRITDAGAIDLADAPHLLRSTSVLLWGNPIGDRTKEALKFRLGDRLII